MSVDLKTFRLVKGLARLNSINGANTAIVRFLDNRGQNTCIFTGKKQIKGELIINQNFLWNLITEGQAHKIAKRKKLRAICQ